MGSFLTADAARARLGELLDVVDAAYAEMDEVCSDEVGTDFRVSWAERLETHERVNRGLMYRVFGELADPPDEAGRARKIKDRLWARLRITPNEVKRRMKVAKQIRPRRQVCGPPLPPVLAQVAAALQRGVLGEDHLTVILTAMKQLPSVVSLTEREEVEASLVRQAGISDAGIVRDAARRIDDIFNPDGHYTEEDRAQRRGMHLSPQGRDGMSKFSGYIDPETRGYVEAAGAAVRPGRHLPDGTSVEVPDERSQAQRCHDGLKLGLKLGLASGEMGSHRGHPVTVIVRTTLGELNQAAHAVMDSNISMPAPARTGGDTAVPMRDLIRMAADAIHYLAVFDDHSERPLYLGRQKRLATADQRIICYARDGGCTRPGCRAPGYHSEVHHEPAWEPDGLTDADHLFFACGHDHARVTDGDWKTMITDTGRLAWTNGEQPPTINHAHHPEELLRGDLDPPEDSG